MPAKYALLALFLAPSLAAAGAQTRHPVLVELFTSEGCSSCPPADALLARLDAEPIPSADIIALGEHVTYWDDLGWRDRFSAATFTERQRQYGTRFNLPDIYTPQMVIAGATQINGSDARGASRAIVQAAQSASLSLTLDTPRQEGARLSATLQPIPSLPPATVGDLYAALVSPAEETSVRSGENGGHTLHHVAVVRSLTRIGTLATLATAPIPFTLPNAGQTPPRPLRLVIFAQSPGQGPILGAVSLNLPAGLAGTSEAATKPHRPAPSRIKTNE